MFDLFYQEIFEAITSGANIIPVFFDFIIPDADRLPTDIQDVLRFNGVNWNHDYQDACVEKLLKYDVVLVYLIFFQLHNRLKNFVFIDSFARKEESRNQYPTQVHVVQLICKATLTSNIIASVKLLQIKGNR